MDDPIMTARALLAQFQRSTLKSAHIRVAGVEIFASRDPAYRWSSVSAAATSATQFVTAPHIATLLSLAAPGTAVAAGDTIAELGLLDETIALAADAAGVVATHEATIGALVEFGQPVLGLAA